MKRKIKFRRFIGSDFIYDDENNCCVFWGGLSEKEEESLSQFTNLFDKNDKEIYEGDVIQWNDLNDPRWSYQSVASFPFDAWWTAKEVQVIGNIYENPELNNNQN